MNEYAISFKRLKNNCKNVWDPQRHTGRKKHACIKRINMKWVKSEKFKKYIDCSESNCPILEKCDQVIP